jgi:hypothetical protein
MRVLHPELRLLTVAFVALSSPILYACDCAEPKFRDALKDAAVVFRGTVVRIDHLNPIQPPDAGNDKQNGVALVAIPRNVDDQTLITFKTIAGWKGSVTATMKVFVVAQPSMCDGYRFLPNVEYVVYASKNLNQYWAELQPFKQGAFIYDVAECPLRIRTDVAMEVRRLGRPSQRFPK